MAKGMSFLLVFFPEESFPITHTSVKRTPNSIRIFFTAQCTISICALLLFTTLILFTLSTIGPTTETKASDSFFKYATKMETFQSPALQRMGTLYRRGTTAMKDLIVGHVASDITDDQFRIFLRALHRSAITTSADVIFIFESASLSSRFDPIIHQENSFFFSLIQHHKNQSMSAFDVTKFFKKGTEIEEPLWGPRSRSNVTSPEKNNDGKEMAHVLNYGSVLRFDPEELDPGNSLAGFLEKVPLSLRRWACYPMLLGRVKRSFKHIMLADVKDVVIVNDPMGRVRKRSSESILLYADRERVDLVNSGIIMGGGKGVRRLSKVMMMEIVRWAMERGGNNSVCDSVVLSQLVGNRFALKNVDLIKVNGSMGYTSSLNLGSATSLWDYVIIQRGSDDSDGRVDSFIRRQLCSAEVESSIYRDC